MYDLINYIPFIQRMQGSKSLSTGGGFTWQVFFHF